MSANTCNKSHSESSWSLSSLMTAVTSSDVTWFAGEPFSSMAPPAPAPSFLVRFGELADLLLDLTGDLLLDAPPAPLVRDLFLGFSPPGTGGGVRASARPPARPAPGPGLRAPALGVELRGDVPAAPSNTLASFLAFSLRFSGASTLTRGCPPSSCLNRTTEQAAALRNATGSLQMSGVHAATSALTVICFSCGFGSGFLRGAMRVPMRPMMVRISVSIEVCSVEGSSSTCRRMAPTRLVRPTNCVRREG